MGLRRLLPQHAQPSSQRARVRPGSAVLKVLLGERWVVPHSRRTSARVGLCTGRGPSFGPADRCLRRRNQAHREIDLSRDDRLAPFLDFWIWIYPSSRSRQKASPTYLGTPRTARRGEQARSLRHCTLRAGAVSLIRSVHHGDNPRDHGVGEHLVEHVCLACCARRRCVSISRALCL